VFSHSCCVFCVCSLGFIVVFHVLLFCWCMCVVCVSCVCVCCCSPVLPPLYVCVCLCVVIPFPICFVFWCCLCCCLCVVVCVATWGFVCFGLFVRVLCLLCECGLFDVCCVVAFVLQTLGMPATCSGSFRSSPRKHDGDKPFPGKHVCVCEYKSVRTVFSCDLSPMATDSDIILLETPTDVVPLCPSAQ
jgi:hypothetical protein